MQSLHQVWCFCSSLFSWRCGLYRNRPLLSDQSRQATLSLLRRNRVIARHRQKQRSELFSIPNQPLASLACSIPCGWHDKDRSSKARRGSRAAKCPKRGKYGDLLHRRTKHEELDRIDGFIIGFLNEYLSASPGRIRTIDGREIGKHDGILFFTIGQGVKIPNQREKYYVCQKNAQTNELIVCPGNHPALFRHDFYVAQSLQMHARSTGTMRCGRALPLFHFSLRIAQHTPIPSPFNANYATKQFANLVISSHL